MVTTTIRMPSMHRLPVLALALVVAALAVTSPLLATAQDGVTVVGKVGEAGYADGMHGVSRITSPTAICVYTPPNADRVGGPDDVVMVVADGYFRMYDRTIGVTTTLRTAAGDLFQHTDGVITGCAQHVTPTQASNVYYVSGDSKVNWIQDGNVHSITVTPDTTKFVSVDVQDDRLFLMTTDMDAVWSCALSLAGPANCRMHTFPASLTWKHTDHSTVAVTSQMLFVATGENFFAFAVPSESDTAVPQVRGVLDYVNYSYNGIDIVAVRKSVDESIYGLSTTSSIYAFGDGYSAPRPLLTADEPSCLNLEGPYQTFCGFTDMYVFNDNEMYMALGERHAVRAKLSGRMRVFLNLPRPPVPASMDDATETLYAVAREVQRVAAKAVPSAEGVFISTADMSVRSDSWRSTVPVQVYNGGYFDSTQKLIQSADYSAAIRAVATYYDKTNEVVAADALLLPMCDGQLMRSVETAIASHASELLQYPVIYTTPIDAAAATAGGTTPVKLLMPAHFNNRTTESTLAAGDFNMAILEELRRSVPADHRYTVELTQEEVNLGAFDERRRQKARADAQLVAVQSLEQCGHEAVASSNTAPAVGVSPIFTGIDGSSHFEVFISPEAYPDAGTGTTLTGCLEGASWVGIGAMSPESDNGSKCGKGCIIGVSVGCACAVLIIIAIVAVFIVRRRKTQAREDTKGVKNSPRQSESDDLEEKSVEPFTPTN